MCVYLAPTGRDTVQLWILKDISVRVWLCDTPLVVLPAPPEGSRADDIAQAAEQLNQRWVGFCALLSDRLAWLAFQAKVPTHPHTHRHICSHYKCCNSPASVTVCGKNRMILTSLTSFALNFSDFVNVTFVQKKCVFLKSEKLISDNELLNYIR